MRTVVAVAFRSLLRMRTGSSGAYNLTVRSSRRRFMASCYLSASGCCGFGCTSLRRGLTQVLAVNGEIIVTEPKKPVWIPTWLGLLVMIAVPWLLYNLMVDSPGSKIETGAATAADQENREISWIERGKAAARSKLKDPESVQFQNIYFHRGKDNIPMTCGEINSKNSFGGYGGFQKFISAGRPELTFLAEQMTAKDFSEVWNRFCAN